MYSAPEPLGQDERSLGEKKAWELLGPPLYYCEHCLRKVKVIPGDDPQVIRDCDHAEARIIAPRRSILAGKGGLSFTNKVKMLGMQIAASITGRCV